MALSRERKTELIIRTGDLLRRMPADKAIHAAGGTTQGEMLRNLNPEDLTFVEHLLDGTIAFVSRDSNGDLRIAPR